MHTAHSAIRAILFSFADARRSLVALSSHVAKNNAKKFASGLNSVMFLFEPLAINAHVT